MNRVFAVVGPSGAGKDTLMEAARVRLPQLHMVQRVITRPETAGDERFEAVTCAEFQTRQADGDFALSWAAHGLHYGIPVSVRDILAKGQNAAFNGSRAMLHEAAVVFPQLRVVHITADEGVLAERLRARGRESEANIRKRLERAKLPLPTGLDVVEIDNSGTLCDAVEQLVRVLGEGDGS